MQCNLTGVIPGILKKTERHIPKPILKIFQDGVALLEGVVILLTFWPALT